MEADLSSCVSRGRVAVGRERMFGVDAGTRDETERCRVDGARGLKNEAFNVVGRPKAGTLIEIVVPAVRG